MSRSALGVDPKPAQRDSNPQGTGEAPTVEPCCTGQYNHAHQGQAIAGIGGLHVEAITI